MFFVSQYNVKTYNQEVTVFIPRRTMSLKVPTTSTNRTLLQTEYNLTVLWLIYSYLGVGSPPDPTRPLYLPGKLKHTSNPERIGKW